MSILYRPVKITSAEQAEAFPVGTIAFDPDYGVATRVDYGLGWSLTGESDSDYHGHFVGFTALVPTEAEEEWALIYEGQEPTPCIDEVDAREWSRIDGEGQAPSRRYTTTWEEA